MTDERRQARLVVPLYVAVLAAGAVALAAAAHGADLRPPGDAEWPVAVALGGLLVGAEYLLVRFRFRGEVNALNLVEAVLAPLLFVFSVPVVVVTVAIAQTVGAVLRRNEAVKSAFNVAQWALASAIGGVVLALAAPDDGPSAPGMLAVLLALTVVAVVNQLAFTIVLSLANRQTFAQVLRAVGPVILPGWVVGWVVNSLVGLLFVLALSAQPLAVVLFPVPLVVLHLAYRGYAGARSDRVRLTGLHRAARALAQPLDPLFGIEPYLREVTRSFEARAAGLVLVHGDAREVHLFDSAQGYSAPTDRSLFDAALGDERTTSRVSAGTGSPLARALAASGWRDCLRAPLLDDDDLVGVLLILDQAGLEGFEAGELAVLEALARETANTFTKGRLVAAALEERRKLEEIVHTTSDGILTIGADGRIQTWNPALERLTGVPAAAVLRHGTLTGLLDVRSATGESIDIAGWADGRPIPAELVVRGPGGASRRLACSYSRNVGGSTDSDLLVVVARDVTPEHEMEELREEFGRLAESEAAQRAIVDELQQAFVPVPPQVPAASLGVCYLPSDTASPTGGDLYDWQLLPSGELHLAVVDVLGHGVSAAKDALAAIHTLRLLALQGCPLGEMVARADVLVGAQDPDLVATVVVARYDPADGTLRLAAGGHPPALLVSPTRGVGQLVAPGCAIGWPGAGSETVVEVQLEPEESLVLYTDGLVEAKKDILEGMEALVSNAAAVVGLSADELASELVARSLAGAARRDDSLALVLQRAPDRTRLSATWTFPPVPASVARMRRAATAWLRDATVEEDDLDEVVVVLSELVTNAVRAARSQVVVRVALDGVRLVLEVEDDGLGDARLAELGTERPEAAAEAGRGLFIVRALVEAVDVLSTREGTVVRAERGVARSEGSPAVGDADRRTGAVRVDDLGVAARHGDRTAGESEDRNRP